MLNYINIFYPQYDGGLKVTSLVVTGIFALASRTGNAPAITEVRVVCYVAPSCKAAVVMLFYLSESSD